MSKGRCWLMASTDLFRIALQYAYAYAYVDALSFFSSFHQSDYGFHKSDSDTCSDHSEKGRITSWISASNPSLGYYSITIERPNTPELFFWLNETRPYRRSGPWNNQIFIGSPEMSPGYLNGWNMVSDVDDETVYLSYYLTNESYFGIMTLNPHGQIECSWWINEKLDQRMVVHRTYCDLYGYCGVFASCNWESSPICSCLSGYKPKNVEDWNRKNWTRGCVRRVPLECGEHTKDGFLMLENMKVPDFVQRTTFLRDECGTKCLKNCSCVAYAYDSGIGCMVWSGDLIDIQKLSNAGTDLYIRVPPSELVKHSDKRRRVKIMIPVGAWKLWNEKNVEFLIDPEISKPDNVKDIVRCIHIGLLCSQNVAAERPIMSTVVSMLNSEIVNLPDPLHPAYVERQIVYAEQKERTQSINNVTVTDIQACVLGSPGGQCTKLSKACLASFLDCGLVASLLQGEKTVVPLQERIYFHYSKHLKVKSSRPGNTLIDVMQTLALSVPYYFVFKNKALEFVETGNLILLDHATGLSIWESFQHPSHAMVPKLKLSTNRKTGDKVRITSWKSSSDPSLGYYSITLEHPNIPQVFCWFNETRPYYRTGPWNGQIFIGLPQMSRSYLYGWSMMNGEDDETVYLSYSLPSQSYFADMTLNPEGHPVIQWWWHHKLVWREVLQRNSCDLYGYCGAFASCDWESSPICTCLSGYKPKSVEEWNKKKWSSGCVRSVPLECGEGEHTNDGFARLENMKVPDSVERLECSEEECSAECLENCSCMAYAYDSGIGCMVWSGDLIDIQKFSSGGVDLYIRVPPAELEKHSDKRRHNRLIIPVGITLGIVALAAACVCVSRKWTAKPTEKINSQRLGMNEDHKQVKLQDELLLFSFAELVNATNDFHSANELVYEYMVNKSLDVILFDPVKKICLDCEIVNLPPPLHPAFIKRQTVWCADSSQQNHITHSINNVTVTGIQGRLTSLITVSRNGQASLPSAESEQSENRNFE
ncbi:hypothetical protein VNO78_03701 [Psophocarpus tetragonolobus]|uniref:Apple domain-containing protein n=1 Tax=Psophocarpus tetragonolobus TaxID=3891 RepID=A0AAN9TEP0_PSOTE